MCTQDKDSVVSKLDPSAPSPTGWSLHEDDSLSGSSQRPMFQRDAPECHIVRMRLHAAREAHPFWQNRLFRACAAGALTRDDFRVIFSQYYLYCQSFTRFLAALMANCENDLHRARLGENLWEEGGQRAPEQRHAELFRRFLRQGLDADVEHIEYLDATRLFVHEYLDFCLRAPPAASSAFLSLGTEGIVRRMYGIFLDGLRRAGVPDEPTEFFRLHMECDDAHAATLEALMETYSTQPDWLPTCQRAMTHALWLRGRFFERLYEHVQARRVDRILDGIQGGTSLAADVPDIAALTHRPGRAGVPLYSNTNERLCIDFSVERIPFATEVFDTRILRIAPRRNNERHTHPHESVFYVIQGRGRVHVNQASFEVGPGDLAFIPRWAAHQSYNLGDDELVILALTDFGLTDQAFIGNSLKTTRLKGTQSARER